MSTTMRAVRFDGYGPDLPDGSAAYRVVEPPIAARFPLVEVRRAFELVETLHSHGKVVPLP
ncbi:hypothetical protein [Kitasatospora sp. NPDC059160]|uniref:hypothetical protein n=1 Tax=Kitasatospora sp. NPDC059160 TaxID=3346748 RepID=UPI00368F5D74